MPTPQPLISQSQGGMGVAVSGWPLARAVSRFGQLGVVSGTPLAVVVAWPLQLGIALSRPRQGRVFTDPVASAAFPFKVARFQNTLSNAANYHARHRVCDLGYLRHLYRRPDAEIGYRCPPRRSNTIGAKAVRPRKPSAASASETPLPQPPDFSRSALESLPNCPSSPEVTTSPTLPDSSGPPATPAPPLTSFACFSLPITAQPKQEAYVS